MPEKRRYCCENVKGGQRRGDCLGRHLHQVGGDQGGGGQVVILVENRMGRPGTPGPRSMQITEYYPSHVCGKLLQLLNFKQKQLGKCSGLATMQDCRAIFKTQAVNPSVTEVYLSQNQNINDKNAQISERKNIFEDWLHSNNLVSYIKSLIHHIMKAQQIIEHADHVST